MDYQRAELSGDIPGMLKAQQRLVATDSNALALELYGEAAVFMLRPDWAVPAMELAEPTFLLMGGAAARGSVDDLAEAYHLAGAHDRELRAVLDAQSILSNPGYVAGRQLRAYAGLARGTAALALADSMVRTSDSSGVIMVRVGMGAAEFRAHGDTATARRLNDLAIRWIAAHPSRSPRPDRQLFEGMALLAAGMLDSAAVRFTSAARVMTRPDAAAYLALIAAARGDRARARTVADSLGALHPRWGRGRNAFWRAAIMGALGERAVAVELLRQAHREGMPMHFWHYEPALDALHGDAGFEALVRPRR
jgi:tetratricopeptide (TPR) repeat protein